MCNGNATESTVQVVQGGEETDESNGGNEFHGRKVIHGFSTRTSVRQTLGRLLYFIYMQKRGVEIEREHVPRPPDRTCKCVHRCDKQTGEPREVPVLSPSRAQA